MGRLRQYMGHLSILVAVSLSVVFKSWASSDHQLAKSTSAFFIFGDSTVDFGNNNYINTNPEYQANCKPYGHNGFFHEPTDRFSDGRLIVDYIAEYAKLPLIPPYLQQSADYAYGANFASGWLEFFLGLIKEWYRYFKVMDLWTQLRNFEEVQKILKEKLGDSKAEEIIADVVYFISIGSNDYIGGYFAYPKMQESYGPEEYVGMVIGNLTHAIQVLYEKGARKFGFLNLSPLGCLRALRVLNPKANEGGCFEAASALALAHNTALKSVLTSFEHLLKGFKHCNSNFYNWLADRTNNPSKYGFKDGVSACCGSGPYRGIFTCGGNKNSSDFQLCENPEDYVWWDSFHPTERIHKQFAKALRNGPPFSVGPFNLHDLFFNNESLTIADLVDVPQEEHYKGIII